MGCWGYGIMESDGALDFEDEFQSIANSAKGATERARLEASLPELLKRAQDEPVFEDQTQFRAEAYQVLTAMLLRVGCAFSEEQRTELLDGLQNCYEYRVGKAVQAAAQEHSQTVEALLQQSFEPGLSGYDDVIERLQGRIQAIEEQAALLRAYSITGGVPVETPSRGLFEVLYEKQKQ